MNSWELPLNNLAQNHPIKLGFCYFFYINGVVLLLNHLLNYIDKSETEFGLIIVNALSFAFVSAIIVISLRKPKCHG